MSSGCERKYNRIFLVKSVDVSKVMKGKTILIPVKYSNIWFI
jgi:hypothetical protein